MRKANHSIPALTSWVMCLLLGAALLLLAVTAGGGKAWAAAPETPVLSAVPSPPAMFLPLLAKPTPSVSASQTTPTASTAQLQSTVPPYPPPTENKEGRLTLQQTLAWLSLAIVVAGLAWGYMVALRRESPARQHGGHVPAPAGWLRRLWHPAYGLVLLWLLMTLKHVEGLSLLSFNPWIKIGSSLVFIALVLATLFGPSNRSAVAAYKADWLLVLGAGGLCINALSLLLRHFTRFGYQITSAEYAWVGGLFLALAVLVWLMRGRRDPRSRWLILGVCWLLFSLAWSVTVRGFPLHGDRSDMLPNIISANEEWLEGRIPYQVYDVGTHRAPMTYLPLLWLAYAPFAALSLDPRWIIPLAQLAFLLVNWAAYRHKQDTPWWSYLLCTVLNPLLFLRHDLHVTHLWPLLALTLLSMLRQRWIFASLLWGCILAFRTSLWVLFPFYLVFLLWNLGLRKAILHGLLAVALAVLICLPFVYNCWDDFIYAIIGYPSSVGKQMPLVEWNRIIGWTSGFSLVPAFFLAGVSQYMVQLQTLVLAVLGTVALVRRPGLVETLKLMSIGLMLFLVLNPLIEIYMHAPLLICVAFAMLAQEESLAAPPGPAQIGSNHATRV